MRRGNDLDNFIAFDSIMFYAIYVIRKSDE